MKSSNINISKPRLFGVMAMASLLLLSSCTNRYEEFNDLLAELPVEKNNYAMIGNQDITIDEQTYDIYELLSPQLVANDVNPGDGALYPESVYIETTLFALVNEAISESLTNFHLLAIDLLSLEAQYLLFIDPIGNEYYPRIFADSQHILIYRNDTHTLLEFEYQQPDIVSSHTFTEITGFYQVIASDGILYRYRNSDDTYVIDAYDYVNDTPTSDNFRSVSEIYHPSRIIDGNDIYDLYVYNDFLALHKNEVEHLTVEFIDFMKLSSRGETIVNMLDERDLSTAPTFIDLLCDGFKYYLGFKCAEGFLFNNAFFGSTPYILFEWDILQEEVSYIGTSEYIVFIIDLSSN